MEKHEKTALKPNTIEEIQNLAQSRTVELTGFFGDGTLVVELQPISVLSLASSGTIPNELLGVVGKLYESGTVADVDFSKKGEAMRAIARAAMKNPTLEQLDQSQIALTDRQLTEIYLCIMNGVKALKTFRSVD